MKGSLPISPILPSSEQQESIAKIIASVAALLTSVALLLMGNGLLTTLIPVRANLENFLPIEIGILGATYFIGFTLGCVAGPTLIKRVGHIRAYLAMVSVASAMTLIHTLGTHPIGWWMLRGVTGFCFAVLYIVIESWLNERSTNKTRGTIFSVYIVIQFTVLSIGQMLLAVGDPRSFSLFAMVSILVSLAALPVALTAATSPNPIPKVRTDFSKLYRTSPVGWAGCVAVGLANGAFWALGPVFAQDQGFDTFGIGLFMSVALTGGALAQWPLGWLSDRIDRRKIIIFAAVVAAVSAGGLALFAEQSQTLTLMFAVGFGMGTFPIYAISAAHANDHAAATEFVQVSSSLLLIYGIGASLGPLVAGLLRHSFSSPSLFLFTSLIHVALIFFVFWRMRTRSAPEELDRVEFTDAIIASETMMPLKPDTSAANEFEGKLQE
jgi:MFS family permease